MSEAFVASMADIIVIILATVTLFAVAATIARYYAISIIAVLIAGAIIIIDHYNNLEKLESGDQRFSTDNGSAPKAFQGSHESTIAWSRLFINSSGFAKPGEPLKVSTLGIMGTNVSDGDIKLEEAYFIGGVNGRKLKVQIGRGGVRYQIENVGSLPPGAVFFVVSDPLGPTSAGVTPGEFLETWSVLSFVAKYNGTTQQLDFDRHTVEASLPKSVHP